MQETRKTRGSRAGHALMLAGGVFLLLSLCTGSIGANDKDVNRKRLVDALALSDGPSLSAASAEAVSSRIPEKVLAEMLAMPGEDRILLYSNWIPLPSNDAGNNPGFHRKVAVFSSQENAFLVALKEWPDSSRIIWDTVTMEIMQPRLRLIRLGDGTGTSDVVIAAGSPSPTRIRHFALIEWSTSGCNLVGDFAGLDIDTLDVDKDGNAELKVRDIKGFITKELVDLIYKRNPSSKRFEYLESRAVAEPE